MITNFFTHGLIDYIHTLDKVTTQPRNITKVKCLDASFAKNRIYAQASKEAYATGDANVKLYDQNSNRYFNLERQFGTDNAVVYSCSDEVIIAYRGTIPTKPSDLIADLAIFRGAEHGSYRYADCVTIYDNVKSKFNQKLTVTGHSLGGNLAVNIAIDKPVDKCVVFNAGSGANKTFSDIQGNTEQRNKFKSLITQYYIHGDVIPALLVGIGSVIIIEKKLNTAFPHSIDYYLDGSLTCSLNDAPNPTPAKVCEC